MELFMEMDKSGVHTEKYDVHPLSFESLGLIDKDLLIEIKTIVAEETDTIYFGKTLRDIKCVIREENYFREHEVFVKYIAPKKLIITSVNLPYAPLHEKEFKSVEEILTSYQSYINSLSAYFDELERIDQFCTVMEPHHPTFKDDFRRILLDSRTWLHVEVTPKGCPTNVHLIGHSEVWHDKLRTRLDCWDLNKDIVENIMSTFDLSEFPNKSLESGKTVVEQTVSTCGICLCDQLPGDVRLPQPLCQNPACGVYFHTNCLYQWLVACAGRRPSATGVVTGACPSCLQPIACSERDTSIDSNKKTAVHGSHPRRDAHCHQQGL